MERYGLKADTTLNIKLNRNDNLILGIIECTIQNERGMDVLTNIFKLDLKLSNCPAIRDTQSKRFYWIGTS